MNRPYIICHMVQSIDGKVTGAFLGQPESAAATDIYYQINRAYKADAFACGRVTMESSFTGGYQPDLAAFADADFPREDYIADGETGFFAVSFDRHGRVGWTTPRIEDEDPGYGNAHIIEVLCEDASDAYLAYLQSIGVSYIFAGEKDLDLSLALEKLMRLFRINKLLLEGGSILNGVFQRADVIDELSLVVAPVTGENHDKPLFMDSALRDYALEEVKSYPDSVVWMKYKRKGPIDK